MNDVIFNEYVRPDIEALRASDCLHEWSIETKPAMGAMLTIPGFSCIHCNLTLKPGTVLYFLTEVTQSVERANLLTFSLYGQIDNVRQAYDRLPPDDKIGE